jgi:hypothetical protein
MIMRTINQAEFLRTFSVMGDGNFDVFLGSGASIQAGIPTGGDLIWYFKRLIYCSETNTSIEAFKDLQSEHIRLTLQNYFNAKKEYPPLYDPTEYSCYFEKCYPTTVARESFIQRFVRNVNPSIGHLCLAHLITNGKVQAVWTTNFDTLIEDGIHTLSPSYGFKVHSSANQTNASQTGDESFFRLYKLHGDYRYDNIKNTTDELQQLEEGIYRQFASHISGKGLVVIGYSGSDDSVMSAFERHLGNLKYGVIWLIPQGAKLGVRASSFMEAACKLNELSCVLEINGFDDFIWRCYQDYPTKSDKIDNDWRNFSQRNIPLNFTGPCSDSFLRTNTFVSTEYPNYKSFKTDIMSWKILKQIKNGTGIIAALFSGQILCFDNDETITKVFGSHILSEIQEESVSDRIQKQSNSVYTGMLYELISASILSKTSAIQFDKTKFYLPSTKEDFKHLYWRYNACEVSLSYLNKKHYFSIVPTIYLQQKDRKELKHKDKQKLINECMSKLYNKQYNEQLKNWNDLLRDHTSNSILFEKKEYSLKFDCISLSCEGLDRATSWPELPSYTYAEPEMAFSIDKNDQICINQLRGLINYGPIDYSFSDNNIIPRMPIRLAIVSPKQGIDKLLNHLNKLNQNNVPQNQQDGFLQPYSNFCDVYRKAIDIPVKTDATRCLLYDENAALSWPRDKFVTLLKHGVDHFSDAALCIDVIVFYIPSKFFAFREDTSGITDFNLHDAVKLYATDHAVKIQFIEDKSIDYYDPCKVMWALSTSLYAKANGVLWHPATLRNDTAFVGISYAYSEQKGISIGCSQLFDSTGTGIRLIIRKILDPGFMGRKNPYMKCDEARSIMSSLRQQYYRSSPVEDLNRVVIHKTTPFTKDEIRGFTQAFEGIEDIELLQIQEYNPWRTVRFGKYAREGPDPFPMKRGTVIQLSPDTFLLWTHGSIVHNDLKGKLNYYKGSRGTPIPLLIKRFYGKASGDTIVNEIMMLTKMNWNSGDSLYKVLPVTLDFAKILSRMSKQNEVIYNKPYDFRYFM